MVKGYHHMSLELLDEIVFLRLSERWSVSRIANKIGYSVGAVRLRLLQAGVETTRDHKLSNADRAEITRRYAAGETCKAIAADFGVTDSAIEYWLKRNGVPRRPPSHRNRKYALNEGAFDSLSPVARYWIGFLYADGCIVDGVKKAVRLDLQVGDRGHLEAFLEFLGSERTPYEVKSKNGRSSAALVVVNSARLVRALMAYGVRPRKSMQSHRLLPEFAWDRDFWRGMVDGDGSVVVTERSSLLSLNGQRLEMRQFSEFVRSVAPRFGGQPHAHFNIWKVTAAGYSAAAVAKCLYDNAEVALPRKAEKARLLVQRFEGKDPTDLDRIDWPPLEELVFRVNLLSLQAVGTDLGVTGTAVRRRLETRGARRGQKGWLLPRHAGAN